MPKSLDRSNTLPGYSPETDRGPSQPHWEDALAGQLLNGHWGQNGRNSRGVITGRCRSSALLDAARSSKPLEAIGPDFVTKIEMSNEDFNSPIELSQLRPFHGYQSSIIPLSSKHYFYLASWDKTPTQFPGFSNVWLISPDDRRILFSDPPASSEIVSISFR